MKRLLRAHGTHLTLVLLAMGCLAALMFMLWAESPASAAQGVPDVALAPLAVPPARPDASNPAVIISPPPVSCTVIYTTNVSNSRLGYLTADPSAPLVGPISNITLVGYQGGYPPQLIPAQVHYFRLSGATVGAVYTLRALPDYGDNYSLAVYVYDFNLTPVYTQTDFTQTAGSATFQAQNSGPYYFQVFQKTIGCDGSTYSLQFSSSGPTPTATNTPTATPQPWTLPDSDESNGANENINQAKVLVNYTGRTLYNAIYPDPRDDQDWYYTYGSAGYQYNVSAAPETGYSFPYLYMEIFAPDKTTLIGRVDSSLNPTINWLSSTSGSYYIHIRRATSSPTNGTYKITLTTNAPATPTFTPTPGTSPTETPVPGLDVFEPNYDFEHAAGIGLNVKYTGINFVPLPGQTINNDFFKLRVKRGMLVTCETLDLSAGTDTNMILYDNNRQGLAGNDDVDTARGDLRSRVTVSINYDGDLYVLIGQGFSVPPAQASQYNYSLQCTSGQTNPTSTPTLAAPPAIPVPTSTPFSLPTLAPAPTTPPTPMPPISVRPIPTPTPAGPAQQIVTADLRVSYDANGSGAADPGEGVVGLPVRVYDDTTGALLAQGFTDDTGHALFSVPAAGPIRVVVPYLSFETIVPPSGAAIPVLISPRGLPDQIP